MARLHGVAGQSEISPSPAGNGAVAKALRIARDENAVGPAEWPEIPEAPAETAAIEAGRCWWQEGGTTCMVAPQRMDRVFEARRRDPALSLGDPIFRPSVVRQRSVAAARTRTPPTARPRAPRPRRRSQSSTTKAGSDPPPGEPPPPEPLLIRAKVRRCAQGRRS